MPPVSSLPVVIIIDSKDINWLVRLYSIMALNWAGTGASLLFKSMGCKKLLRMESGPCRAGVGAVLRIVIPAVEGRRLILGAG